MKNQYRIENTGRYKYVAHIWLPKEGKVTSDTDADDLMRWFYTNIVRIFSSNRVLDKEHFHR